MSIYKDTLKKFEKLGVVVPEILLPAKHIDLAKWSVIACDQYTSEPLYWEKVASFVGDSPSTFHMILPEIYLEEENCGDRVEKIYKNMEKYIRENVLIKQNAGLIYIERMTKNSSIRKGLVVSVDLEKYDFNKGSQSMIRATEGTVIERLPARTKIRERALIEIPHILLLVDDWEKTIIEPISEKVANLEKLYDFNLMFEDMNIKGYRVDDEKLLSDIANGLEQLVSPDKFATKYCMDKNVQPLLFAVGDGNHSLAAAKVHWENVKKDLDKNQIEHHPSRYALVEVVNVHDEGIIFEPIHRVVFNADTNEMLDCVIPFFGGSNNCFIKMFDLKTSFEEQMAFAKEFKAHAIPFVSKDASGVICINNPKLNLEVGSLQAFLDYYTEGTKNVKVDYIHGEDAVQSLGTKEGNIGFFLPAMDKQDLFKTVILDGALPRKTFSMGKAEEKRFYLESRKIV